ncbi:MAG: sulfatase-like hydrolase/transferase [Pseudomonadota bacterium]
MAHTEQNVKFGAVHIFGIWALAIAAPILDVLSNNIEFAVAHNLNGFAYIIYILTLLFAAPAAASLAIYAINTFSQTWAYRLLLFAVGLFGAFGASLFLNKIALLPSVLQLVAATMIGGGFAALYHRKSEIRAFLTFVPIASVAIVLWSLVATPARTLFVDYDGTDNAQNTELSADKIPIVYLIFDELNTTSLYDQTGAIDAERFPNFALLAENSTFYPWTAAVAPGTVKSLPSMVTGVVAAAEKTVPTSTYFPENLFTWLNGVYEVSAYEPVTQLCPKNVCREHGDQIRVSVLAMDTLAIFGHSLLPPKIAESFLPSITGNWSNYWGLERAQMLGFDRHEAKEIEEWSDIADRIRNVRDAGRAGEFERVVATMTPGSGRLTFLHFTLPHRPYEFYPSGSRYMSRTEAIGLLPGGVWEQDIQPVKDGYRQYMMQLGYVDRLLGKVIEKLRKEKIYDKALLIVTADHGTAFIPGEKARVATDNQIGNLFNVPLFIKLPGQVDGRISQLPASSVDIMPTIADVIDARLSWEVDGQSLIDESDFTTRTHYPVFLPGAKGKSTMSVETLHAHHKRSRDAFDSIINSNAPLDRLWTDERFAELQGKPIETLDVGPPIEQWDLRVLRSERWDNVNLAGRVPGPVEGTITPDSERAAIDLAIGFNGEIVAIANAYPKGDGDWSFLTIVPRDMYRRGRNELRVFVVESSQSGGSTLHELSLDG